MIDLRSDVKTLPTELMRQSIFEAELGDDMAGEDPTVKALETKAAELMGMEAALLVTSGVQGNLVSMLAHTQPGQKIILHDQAHILHYERAGLARVAGLLAHLLPGPYGTLDPAAVEEAIWPPDLHRAATGLVALENTHNRAGGTCLSVEQTEAICAVAHQHGVPVHIDGARIFNAAVALGVEARKLAAPADSIMFCFSKSLGAPIGSMVCGNTDFIQRAREARKLLGGAMRQAGIIAAPALVALEHELPRLAEDHEKARRIATTLSRLPGVQIDMATVQTNIIIFELHREDMTAPELCQRLADYDINAIPQSDVRIRFVTHRDISIEDTERVCAALSEVLA